MILVSSTIRPSHSCWAIWEPVAVVLGEDRSVIRLDRKNKEISLAPTLDENGDEYIPRRTFKYDSLVLAVGSQTNDFGIKGVKEHCLFLDTRVEADLFHQNLLRSAYATHTQTSEVREGHLKIAIAGAGATGVELSAELHEAINQLVEFGLDQISTEGDIKISIKKMKIKN